MHSIKYASNTCIAYVYFICECVRHYLGNVSDRYVMYRSTFLVFQIRKPTEVKYLHTINNNNNTSTTHTRYISRVIFAMM